MVTSLRQILEGTPFFQTLNIFSAWEKALGPHITKHAHPVKLQNGALTVAASSAAWAVQLRFLSTEIKTRLNQFLGREEIQAVTFFVDQKEQGKQDSQGDQGNQGDQGEKKYVCSVCGVKISREGKCLSCRQEERNAHENKIVKMFRNTPWISFQEASETATPLGKEEFERVRKRMKGGFYDQLWKAAKELSRKELKDVSKIRNILYDYVMIKTGKRPAELNVKILQKNVPAKLWQMIKGAM
jgi:hypothetical protein